MNLGTARIVHGNALDLPLDDNSVDLVVTSPPYFGLRSYQDGGEHYAGQIGAEPTPAEFVDALIAATREMMRVVKPSGSIWVNLGDKYAGSRMDGSSGNGSTGGLNTRKVDGQKMQVVEVGAEGQGKKVSSGGIPTKSLMGVPWRYALRCIDDLGLILRAEVIWSKPNGLPESVTDRVRRSHEQWFHFTLEPRYYSAVDEIREEHAPQSIARTGRNRFAPDLSQNGVGGPNTLDPTQACNPLGKLPGSVWTVPTQPLTVPASLGVDHFAAFPMEWPRRIITGWSPREVCTACGEGRRPVTSRTAAGRVEDNSTWTEANGPDRAEHLAGLFQRGVTRTVTGYECSCPDTTAPSATGVVLDPFGGTGTTALVAKALGRDGISVDLSSDYCRLAEWRTTDPGQLAAALQVEKPEPVDPLQMDLFTEDIA